MRLTETAYAKINLALHVRRRRSDGYHDIETIFAFVDAGDILTARESEVDQLQVTGPFAGNLEPFGNIVSLALNALPRPTGWHVTLEKALPVAAGLGGGSADAGAIFRMVEAAQGLPDDWQDKAARLGADVPACVRSIAALGEGTGTKLKALENDLAGVPVLLVNPRVPLATADVFATWDGRDRGGLAGGNLREVALAGRNDLQGAAISLCPDVGSALAELDDTQAMLVRMSGSGATCFALYDTAARRDAAREAIAALNPTWWTMAGALR